MTKSATKKTRTLIKEQEQEPYWICDICVKEKKLVTRYPFGGNTIAFMDCGYCGKKETWTTPIVDFKRHNAPQAPWD